MVVIVSDLHITDTSTAINIDPTAFDILKDSIITNVHGKSANELHIVLLGDILDLERTDYWCAAIPYGERPWNGELDSETGMNKNLRAVEQQFLRVLERILAAPDGVAAAFFAMLTSLQQTVQIPVRIMYVYGNHDRAFSVFESLRQRLRAVVPGIEFASEYRNTDYALLARHGHQWDQQCYSKELWEQILHPDHVIDRFDPRLAKVIAIGDVVTAELMSGFIYNCRAEFRRRGFTSEQDKRLLSEIMDVNNVRPITDAFLWLRWFTRNQEEKYGEPIAKAFLDALNNVLNSSFAKQWDRLSGVDLTDILEFAKLGVKVGSLDVLERAVAFAKTLLPKSDAFKKGARDEFFSPARDRRIHYIVYGHTHEERQDYFSGDRDLFMYINVGTYLPFIQMAEEQRGFVTAHRMTMAFFYNANEDKSNRADNAPTMQLWNGIRKKNYTRQQPPSLPV